MGKEKIIEILIYSVTLAGILAASYTDWKRHKIPLYIFPPVFMAALSGRMLTGAWVLESFAGFGVVLFASLLASFAGMGGGDVIMLSTIAFVVGSRQVVPFLLLMATLVLLYAVYRKCIRKDRRKLRVPLAPFCILPYLYSFFSFLCS